MTTERGRPNYFIILGLDPAARFNDAASEDAAFGDAIRDKRSLWSRQRGGIKGRPQTVEAQRNLALMADIERVMLRDRREREREREEALRQAGDETRARRAEFAEAVDTILAKGFLWDFEYEELRRDAAFSAVPVLRQRVEDAPKRSRGGQQSGRDSGRLDGATERILKAHLLTLRQPDLYAVLRDVRPGVGVASPRADLLAAADELYQRAHNMADKNRPEVGAMQQLAGLAQLIFRTDEMRERHDVSTRLFPLDTMLTRYEQTLARARAIDASQAERFLREAARQGIDIGAAADEFETYFTGKNWKVDMPSTAARYRLLDEAGQSSLEPAMAGMIRKATDLMDERRYNDALRALRSLGSRPTMVVDLIGQLIAECDKAIGDSGRLCQQAGAPGLDDEYRVQLYMQALGECADNSDARDALARIPPPPPRGLRAEADPVGQVVRLTWEPADGLSYSSVIYRADGPAPPAAPSELDRRATVRSRGAWEDTEPLIGRPMWYAVYTERGGTRAISREGEVVPRAVLLAVAPAFSARAGDGEVALSWTLPDNADGLEISRGVIGPDGAIVPGTTVSLPTQGTQTRSLTDPDTANGSAYRYAARAAYRYRTPGGLDVVHRSAETTRDATPILRPQPPGPVQARGAPAPKDVGSYLYKVELDWSQGDGDGVVKVVRSVPDGVSILPGRDFPERELHSSQLVLEPDQRSDIWWFDTQSPLCSYTPVLFLNGWCYAGAPRHFASGPEVTNLEAEPAGAVVRVRWSWPDEIDIAVVAWDARRDPFDPVAATHQQWVRRPPGQQAARFDLPVDAPAGLYVRVAAVRRSAGIDYVTSGVTTGVTVVGPTAEAPPQAPEPEPGPEPEPEIVAEATPAGPRGAEPPPAESFGSESVGQPDGGPSPGRRRGWPWRGHRG